VAIKLRKERHNYPKLMGKFMYNISYWKDCRQGSTRSFHHHYCNIKAYRIHSPVASEKQLKITKKYAMIKDMRVDAFMSFFIMNESKLLSNRTQGKA